MPASTATDIASPAAFEMSTGTVSLANHPILQARLKAPLVALFTFAVNPLRSRSRSSAAMTTPPSIAPDRIRPISIGLISSLDNIRPRSAPMDSPASTAVTVFTMDTLPFSILAGMPTELNSPTIGPGGNEVGPASMTISDGISTHSSRICSPLSATIIGYSRTSRP